VFKNNPLVIFVSNLIFLTLGVGAIKHHLAKVVSQFCGQLLAVKTFVNGHVIIHGVAWQMFKFFKWIVTLKQPCYLKISHKVQRVVTYCLILLRLVFKDFRFEFGIWQLIHSSNSLEARGLIDAENQDNMINGSQSHLQSLRWLHGCCPRSMLHRNL
jgi:hypothetical protein